MTTPTELGLLAEAVSRPLAGDRLANKVALVTGVNDRGIGSAIVERLAREGAAVVMAGLEQAPRLARKLARGDTPHLTTHCDVTRWEDITATIDSCMEEFGQLDVLVNNAGVESTDPFESFTPDTWRAVVDINLNGAALMSQAALPYLTEPGGAIVNIASILASHGCPGCVAYSASKAGLVGMTRSLALELAPRGIRVNCVSPAFLLTPMTKQHLLGADQATRDRFEAEQPLGLGNSHDVAAAVAFLASNDARWVTGIDLPLGWLPTYRIPVPELEDE